MICATRFWHDADDPGTDGIHRDGQIHHGGHVPELGVPVWDADAAVHRIYAAGGPGGAALSDIAPSAVGEDGAVDRGTLRAAIAENPIS
jgi:dephospho-CoA kinase